MDKFLIMYDGYRILDEVTTNSSEAKSFARRFKNYLKRALPECRIAGFRLGHYSVSAFLERGGKFVYIHYNIPRFDRPIDIHCGEIGHPGAEDVLIRTAENENDHVGGANFYCSLATIPQAAETMLERGCTAWV